MAQAKTNGTSKDISTGDVADQIDTLKADIATLTSLIGELSEAKTKDMRDKAYDAGRKARETAYEKGHEARETAEAYYAEAEETVRRQPMASLGLAAGLGFLVGMMTARR